MAKRKSSLGGWLLIGLIIFGVSQFARAPGDATSSSANVHTSPATLAPQVTTNFPAQTRPLELRYVTATSLNVRRDPGTSGTVIAADPHGTRLTILDRRNGWLLVDLGSNSRGWVSERFTATSKPPEPRYVPPAPISQPIQSAAGLTCSPRRTCGQIPSCSAAQWYRQNCSWGGRLDRDNDGLACETLC